MKKLISLSLAAVMLMATLVACGTKADTDAGISGSNSDASILEDAGNGANDGAVNGEVNLEEFYATIFTDPENSPAMMPMDAEGLEGFYPGLTELALKQTVAYMPMISAVACEIVMVECENAADVETVKGIFETRIETQVNDHFNYPATIETWEKEAQVVVNGNYVALFVVNGMTEDVVASFNAAVAG